MVNAAFLFSIQMQNEVVQSFHRRSKTRNVLELLLQEQIHINII